MVRKNLHISTFLIISLGFLMLTSSISTPSKVSMRMVSKSISKGKTSMLNAEVFFQLEQTRLITRKLAPLDYILVTSPTGEARAYYQKTNEVMNKKAVEFDPEKALLYFFFVGKMNDMGMKDLGFNLTDTKFEEKRVTTTWFPPASLINVYSKIEMLHQDFRPVSVTFFDKTEKVVRKITYSDFSSFSQFSIPTTVNEKIFLPQGDTVVNTITYSEVKVDDKSSSSYYNFRIPVNAKIKE